MVRRNYVFPSDKLTEEDLYDDYIQFILSKNLPDGEHELRCSINKLFLIKFTISNGSVNGNLTGYNNEATRVISIHYTENIRNGLFNQWYSDNHMMTSGLYHEGEPTGVWRFYDKNGILDHIENYQRH